MDILTYINRMNQIYGNGPAPAPRYNTQQYLQGGRVGYKPGGIVEPGVMYYGKSTVDDLTQGVKAGEELGENITQTKKGYQLQMGHGDNRITRHRKSLAEVKAYKDQVISEGWKKKKTGRPDPQDLFKDPLFEQFFNKELNKNDKLKKAIADLPENATLKEKWGHLTGKHIRGTIKSKFNEVYKRDLGYLNLDQLSDFTQFKSATLQDAFYHYEKYKGVMPDITKVTPDEYSKAKRAVEIVDQLKEIGITKQNVPGTYRSSPTGKFKGILAKALFNLPDVDQIIKLRDMNKLKGEQSLTTRAEITKASKNSPEYLKMEYGKDRGNMNKLLKTLNASFADLDEVELKKLIKNNPALEEMVTSRFNASGDIVPGQLDDLTFNEIKNRIGFEREHVRSLKTVKIDPITKEVLDGLDIEYPKNLRITIKGFNNPFKESAEKWVQGSIKNIKDPLIKGKIDKIDNFFTKFGQAYSIVDPTTNTQVVRGAAESNLLKNIQALGFTGKEEVFDPKLIANIENRLKEFCNYGSYAEGGRIGFKAGSCSPEVAAKNFARASEDLVQGRVTGKAGQELAKKIGTVTKAGSKGMFSKLLGPYGIGLDVVFEAGMIGTDVLKGKPLNEAVADNWITGAAYKTFTGKTGEKLLNERLAKLDSSTKIMGNAMNLSSEVEDLNKELARMEADRQVSTTNLGKKEIEKKKAEIAKKTKEFNTLTKDGTLIEQGTPAYESYYNQLTELRDSDRAKSIYSKYGPDATPTDFTSDRYVPREKAETALPENYSTFKPNLFTQNEILDFAKKQNIDLTPEQANEVVIQDKWKQLFKQPGIKGTQDKFFNAGGRVSFKLGGIDKGKRAFLKFLAAIGIGGATAGTGLIKLGGKTATKVVPKVTEEVIKRGADGTPAYLADLIKVVKAKGIKKIVDSDINKMPDTVHSYKGVDVTEDAAGNIKIKHEHPNYSQQDHIQIEKGQMNVKDEGLETQKSFQEPDEYIEGTVRPDMDGKFKDFEEGLDTDVHKQFKEIADEGTYDTYLPGIDDID